MIIRESGQPAESSRFRTRFIGKVRKDFRDPASSCYSEERNVANEAEQPGATNLPVSEQNCEWSEPTVQADRTGLQQKIAGLNAEQTIITATQTCTDPETKKACDVTWTLEQWLAPSPWRWRSPGILEELCTKTWHGRPCGSHGWSRNGPAVQSIRGGLGGNSEAVGGAIAKGLLGGFGKKKKAKEEAAAAEAVAAAPEEVGSVRLFRFETETTKIDTKSLPAKRFEVPAGFKLKD